VLIDQGASVIVAMLGVWKAGKIFVPLDTRQPTARMLKILDDCQAELLVTDDSSLSDAQAVLRPGMQLVNLDKLDAALSSKDVLRPISADAPACVMYTSGSTGLPKGVVQTHRNLLHKTMTHTATLQLGQRDRLAQLATCSVGQGLTTALQALLNGASLYPFGLQDLGVGKLAPWLIAHAITVYASSASTFRHFAKTLTADEKFPSLRVIKVGMERVFPHDFELYQRHLSRDCVFVTTYSSTETGLVTNHVMDHASHITDVVPAGYPVDGMAIHDSRRSWPRAPGGTAWRDCRAKPLSLPRLLTRSGSDGGSIFRCVGPVRRETLSDG
jgi:acyl-coenzyme A synthetase/AMP-(fatty) acid ligase